MNSATKTVFTAAFIFLLLVLTMIYPTGAMILFSALFSGVLFIYFTYKVLTDQEAVPENSHDEYPVP